MLRLQYKWRSENELGFSAPSFRSVEQVRTEISPLRSFILFIQLRLNKFYSGNTGVVKQNAVVSVYPNIFERIVFEGNLDVETL